MIGDKQKNAITWIASVLIVLIVGIFAVPGALGLFDSGDLGNAFSGYQFTSGYYLSEILLTDTDRLHDAQRPVITYDELFDPYAIHSITVHIDTDEWQELIEEMRKYYDTFGNYRAENYKKATMTYTIAGHTYDAVIGFRTKGDGTRDLPVDDGKILRSDFAIQLRDGSIGGVDKFLLESNRYDRSQLVQLYSHHVLQSLSPLVARATSTRLILQIGDENHDLGVYTLIEPIDEHFLERRGRDGAILYKARSGGLGSATLESIQSPWVIGQEDRKSNYRPIYDRKTQKGSDDHSPLLDLIQTINTLSGDAFAQSIDEIFDTDSLLHYMAANVLLGNPDDYWGMGNNYYLAFLSGHKTVYIPTDLDNGLGEGSMASAGWTATLDPYTRHRSRLAAHGHSPILIDQLFQWTDFRQKYTQAIYDLLDSNSISTQSFQDFESMFDSYPSSRWAGERDSSHVYEYLEQRLPWVKKALD